MKFAQITAAMEETRYSLIANVNNNVKHHGMYSELNEHNLGEPLIRIEEKQVNSQNNIDLLIKDEPNTGHLGGDVLEKSNDITQKAFSDLTAEERTLVSAFARAVIRERDHNRPDLEAVAAALDDVSVSGRTEELFQRIQYLSTLPPARAPFRWDSSTGEFSGDAIARIYGHWLESDRMHQGVLRTLDPPLYRAFVNKKRANPMPPLVAEKLVTKKVFNTRRLEGSSIEDFEGRLRLRRLRNSRKLGLD